MFIAVEFIVRLLTVKFVGPSILITCPWFSLLFYEMPSDLFTRPVTPEIIRFVIYVWSLKKFGVSWFKADSGVPVFIKKKKPSFKTLYVENAV